MELNDDGQANTTENFLKNQLIIYYVSGTILRTLLIHLILITTLQRGN